MKIWDQLWKVSYKVVKIIEKYQWTSSFLSKLQATAPLLKMNFSAGIFQGFSHHVVTRTFWSPSKRLLLNPAAQLQEEYCAWNRLFYGTLLNESYIICKNSSICSRGVNRLVTNRYFSFFQWWTKIVVN